MADDDDARRDRERDRLLAEVAREVKRVARDEMEVAIRDALRAYGDRVRELAHEVFVTDLARVWDVSTEDFRELRIDIKAAAAAHKQAREMGSSAAKTMREELVKAIVAAILTAGAVVLAITVKGVHL